MTPLRAISLRVGFGVALLVGVCSQCGHPPAATTPSPAPAKAPELVEWPNAESRANSDPWIAQHHTTLRAMHPQVLVLNFVNQKHASDLRPFLEQVTAGMREGSRYHGYEDAAAPPFLFFEIAKVVDLVDDPPTAGWTFKNSSKMPIKKNKRPGAQYSFDYAALFSPEFAPLYGLADPNDPKAFLDLCALFERGLVHEVWTSVAHDKTDTRLQEDQFFAEEIDNRQKYDASGAPIPGAFDRCAGNGCFDLEDVPHCKVTVRIGGLIAERGPGCKLHGTGHAIEGIGHAMPAFAENFRHFDNADFGTRLGAPFDSWYSCGHQPNGTDCVTYDNPTSASWRVHGAQGTFAPFEQGCGNVHFPPNGRFAYDYDNTQTVLAQCESFGTSDAGATEPISRATWARYDAMAPDCGGGWQIYWRQSFPGLDNNARDKSGAPMKNWWPFLFY